MKSSDYQKSAQGCYIFLGEELLNHMDLRDSIDNKRCAVCGSLFYFHKRRSNSLSLVPSSNHHHQLLLVVQLVLFLILMILRIPNWDLHVTVLIFRNLILLHQCNQCKTFLQCYCLHRLVLVAIMKKINFLSLMYTILHQFVLIARKIFLQISKLKLSRLTWFVKFNDVLIFVMMIIIYSARIFLTMTTTIYQAMFPPRGLHLGLFR